jgi:hypothetical protein
MLSPSNNNMTHIQPHHRHLSLSLVCVYVCCRRASITAMVAVAVIVPCGGEMGIE